MKYHPPVNASNPNAAYVDRDTPNAQRGSAVPAKAIEHPQREIANAIDDHLGSGAFNSGQDEVDLRQLSRIFTQLRSGADANFDIRVDGWQSSPPINPVNGARYVVKSSGADGWASKSEKIAIWRGEDWVYYDAKPGLLANFEDQGVLTVLWFNGSAWDVLLTNLDISELDDRFIPQIIDGRAQTEVLDPGLPDENQVNLFPVPGSGSIGQYAAITGALDVEFRPLSGAGLIRLVFRLQINSREDGIVVYYVSGEFNDAGFLQNVDIYSNNPSGAKKVYIHFDNSDGPVWHFYVGDLTDVHTMASVHCTMQSVVSDKHDSQTRINLGSLKPRYESTAFKGTYLRRIDVRDDIAFRRFVGSFFSARTNSPANLLVPNETWTKVYAPVQLSDLGDFYSIARSRFEPRRSGSYLFHWTIHWLAGSPTNIPVFNSAIFKNSDPGNSWPGSSSSATRYGGISGGSAEIFMNGTTDYVDLYGLCSLPSGGNGKITYASWTSSFYGVLS
ncbi:MAG: DUF2793 domain-containing protein [Pseudomonadota bacterium]